MSQGSLSYSNVWGEQCPADTPCWEQEFPVPFKVPVAGLRSRLTPDKLTEGNQISFPTYGVIHIDPEIPKRVGQTRYIRHPELRGQEKKKYYKLATNLLTNP